MTHLTPEQLLDAAEAERPTERFPHLNACVPCSHQMMDLRRTRAAVQQVEVPDPSPLLWSHLSARVRAAVAAEQAHRPSLRWQVGTRWRFATALAAAAVLVWTVAAGLREAPALQPVEVAVENAFGAALDIDAPPFEDDPALVALADLTSELDWDAASAAGLFPARGTVDRVMLALSDEERAALRQVLQESM